MAVLELVLYSFVDVCIGSHSHSFKW